MMRNTVLLVFSILTMLAYGQSGEKVMLEAGTIVPVIANQEINVHQLKNGDIIDLVTARAVVVKGGKIAIPINARVEARVRTTLRDYVPQVSRRVIIDIQKVVLEKGKVIPLTDGVISFTPRTVKPERELVPLRVVSPKKAFIPTDYEMQPKVEVTQTLE